MKVRLAANVVHAGVYDNDNDMMKSDPLPTPLPTMHPCRHWLTDSVGEAAANPSTNMLLLVVLVLLLLLVVAVAEVKGWWLPGCGGEVVDEWYISAMVFMLAAWHAIIAALLMSMHPD